MVSFSAYAAAALAFVGIARAGFYTTYPVGADAIMSGQTIQIKWEPRAGDPDLSLVKSYTLKFMTGGNAVQTTVAVIGTFDISQTTVTYTIPKTVPGMYFLMYTATGGGSSWSTRFSIDRGTTWYPEGVATGRDPDASSTGKPTSAVPSSAAPSSASAPSSALPASSSSVHASPTADVTTSSVEPKASNDTDSASSGSDDNSASSDDASNHTQLTSELGSLSDESSTSATRSKTSKTSSTHQSKTKSAPESSDVDSLESDSVDSESESSSSGAATYFLSAVAILVASVGMI
ncbi:hypothetical protein LPJ61_000497 [Coemansia biformis]|uniref:Ser-Thr-rich glycosyl-phosphatidyl-inositol-anchored membrane family-domain-containing protein n=1 Tax=Coemansia biformis TaxID=1286918 RepID=A0A9W8D0G9_9FUNG|nr:hypothetical protein LPJ61_000497 [Coemansia biformis]